jgi:hypothetical protein
MKTKNRTGNAGTSKERENRAKYMKKDKERKKDGVKMSCCLLFSVFLQSSAMM